MSSVKTNEQDLGMDVGKKSCWQDLQDDKLSNLATSAGETGMKVKSSWPMKMASGHNGNIVASLVLTYLIISANIAQMYQDHYKVHCPQSFATLVIY